MKICMYIQDISPEKLNDKVFNRQVRKISKEKPDLFVLPESSYTPYTKMGEFFDVSIDEGLDIMRGYCNLFSEKVQCPVVYGGKDMYSAIYSLYINGANTDEETFSKFYIKHTETTFSPFYMKNYARYQATHLSPLNLKGTSIGLVAGEDCKHSAFARLYGQAGADILINSAKSGIDYNQWYFYNRARAVENNCFVFCVTSSKGEEGDAFTMGFTPRGGLMKFKSLIREGEAFPVAGNIRVYDTEDTEVLEYTAGFAPENTQKAQLFIKPSEVRGLSDSAKALGKGLYVKEREGYNLVICVLEGADILLPEETLRLLYNPAISDIPNKRYLLINKWDESPDGETEEKLAAVLPVRAMENHCAVIMVSPEKALAFGRNSEGSPVALTDSGKGFGIELGQAEGPESVWVDIPGSMSREWRAGYEKLIKILNGGKHEKDDSDQNASELSAIKSALPECGFLDLL